MSRFADIALPVPVFQIYTYEVPECFRETLTEGFRVLVPFGKRKMTGYVVGIKDQCNREDLKPIHDLLDPHPVLSAEMISLARWISEYYLCPLGETIKAMLPGGTNLESRHYLSLQATDEQIRNHLEKYHVPRQEKILALLREHKQLSLQQLRKRFRAANLSSSVASLVKAGLIKSEINITSATARPKFEYWLQIHPNIQTQSTFDQICSSLLQTAPAQALCLAVVREHKQISQKNLIKTAGVSNSAIITLIQKEIIQRFEKEVVRSYLSAQTYKPPDSFALNEYQNHAIYQIEQAINQDCYQTFLLHGVTGSGKTQVYIEAIKRAQSKDKTAIVLVPEIALTPQTVSRFTSNFPGLVSVLHSRMSPGERYDSWRKLKQGQYRIAIGPRSAVFAPLENLGLIVVDEEHESSYKQYDNQPLYNARDVAVYRGRTNNAVVILGSATPSLESYYNAKAEKYQLLELPLRIDDVPMPQVTIVDMIKHRKEYPAHDVSIFSKFLHEKIQEKLAAGQQIILLQNRRGFSTHIKCKDCGHIEKCKHCEITLTYHEKGHLLRCHYCTFTKKAPSACPQCHGVDILFRGVGTQRVEKEIGKMLPQARVVRMDLDTTSRKWAHDRILSDFGEKKFDVLLGTQMVAKGLDFENVTLVGVISADTSLLLPDFRATERTFQLLTQVAGRAGRKGLAGEVYIQTYSPDNLGLKFAEQHDYKGFFLHELPLRKELNYPPFWRLVCLLFRGESEEKVRQAAFIVADMLRIPEALGKVYGPVASPLSKIQDMYRWQLIIKANKQNDSNGKLIRRHLKTAMLKYRSTKNVRDVKLSIDVDPVSLL
ncbi:MAG TPA: primosomal protein N' [bacterium]|nr:primosomal protein N' [bacterium]